MAGLVLYVLFSRMRGGVGRTKTLTRQELPRHPTSTLERVEAEHEAALSSMPHPRDRLARLIYGNARAYVTTSNRVTILQNASQKYSELVEDLRRARSSVHLQYYIWQNDAVTRQIEAILAERASARVGACAPRLRPVFWTTR